MFVCCFGILMILTGIFYLTQLKRYNNVIQYILRLVIILYSEYNYPGL